MILKPETKLSRNFTYKEFLAASHHPNIDEIEPDYLLCYLIPWLQDIRDHNGDKSITITSFVRSKEYNTQIGGVANSTHTRGMAVDFTMHSVIGSSHEMGELAEFVKKLHPDIRFKTYPSEHTRKWFCHMDCGRIVSPDEYPAWQELG